MNNKTKTVCTVFAASFAFMAASAALTACTPADPPSGGGTYGGQPREPLPPTDEQ